MNMKFRVVRSARVSELTFWVRVGGTAAASDSGKSAVSSAILIDHVTFKCTHTLAIYKVRIWSVTKVTEVIGSASKDVRYEE